MTGGSGNDRLSGGDDSDRLEGDAGNDILNGGSGLDTLIGGSGSDTFSGGSGADKFSVEKGATPLKTIVEPLEIQNRQTAKTFSLIFSFLSLLFLCSCKLSGSLVIPPQ